MSFYRQKLRLIDDGSQICRLMITKWAISVSRQQDTNACQASQPECDPHRFPQTASSGSFRRSGIRKASNRYIAGIEFTHSINPPIGSKPASLNTGIRTKSGNKCGPPWRR